MAAFLVVLFLLSGNALPAADSPGNKFLIASDIHFNPFADPALVADLAAAPATQWEAIFNRSKLTAYSQYSHDTNWWLLQSALNAMRKTLPHPALVMITGDSLAHGFPQQYKTTMHNGDDAQYRAFVLKTVEFLALELRKRFRTSKILITPGNNDDECGDYDIEANGPFLSDTANAARSLAKADDKFVDDWKSLGSYTVDHPTIRGIRILSLNTVFFSNKYNAASFAKGCAVVDSAAADRTFAWLESNLAQARADHQKVWLMFHIPPGIDGYSTMAQYRAMSKGIASPSEELCSEAIVPMWKPVWTSKFNSLLESFQDTVAASFAGHDHTDDFRLIGGKGTRKTFVLIDPPISPVYGQNPSFRVVTFRKNGDLADQSTYYLTNLKLASSETQGQWKREYRFSSQWHTQQLDADSLGILYSQIRDNSKVRAQWVRLYNVSSSAAHVPPTGVSALYCASGALDPSSYQTCYCPVTKNESVPKP